MNCPNCGSQTLADHQFCRSCGADLAEGEKPSFNPRAWGLLILMLAFGGLLITITGKMLDLRWLLFTGTFIMIGGMFFVATYALWRQTRPRKHKPAQTAPAEITLRADTTNKLLPIGDNDFIPAVTEATTNLLKTPVSTRSDRGD